MKKTFISKRQSLLKLMIFIVTMIFIIYKFPNPLLLVIILHKKHRYGMTEYNQS